MCLSETVFPNVYGHGTPKSGVPFFLFRQGLSVIRLVYGAYRQFVKDEAGLSCVGRVGHVLHCACKFAG